SRYPVSVANDYSPPLAERIRACLARDRYDLLVCDFVQPSVNLGAGIDCPVLLFQHNVESMIFERHARTAGSAPLRWFWRSQWRKMERFARDACRRLGARSDVTITGRVDDVRPHMARADVCVIPLRIGGGTRIKAYEAMAMAKPVVSTPIGVEGLPVRDDEHLIVAEHPEDFAGAV